MRSVEDIQTDDRLWTVKDVAYYLCKGRTWVYNQVAENRIPFRRVGGELRFEPDAIKRWFRGEPPIGGAVVALPRK